MANQQVTDDYAEQLIKLEKEELQLIEQRNLTLKTSIQQSLRDLERCFDGVKRAIPELDVVSKTSAELRTSIRKTMERADVVSVKVRELDLSRSRALECLQYANRCVECKKCVTGAKAALINKELEIAAGFVKKFDDISLLDQLPGTSEMQSIRLELERSILESSPHHHYLESTSSVFGTGTSPPPAVSSEHQKRNLREQAVKEDWLESEAVKEALKQASVMSKVSDASNAESRYAHFLASYLKERVTAEYERVQLGNFESGNPGGNIKDDSKVFVDTLKYLFNSSASLIESNIRIPEAVLSKNARPAIFKCVNSECDRQCTILFDSFMAGRRIHERAGRQEVEKDLTKLNHLLVEICIAMQHVETYDRFVRAKPMYSSSDYNPEYRRIVQEVAGAYTLLEKKWITESLKRAKKAENLVHIVVSGRTLEASTLVEDAFYVCRRAIKRSLGTGSSQATCGCVNQVSASLEDALLPFFSNAGNAASTSTNPGNQSSSTSMMDPVFASSIQINSLELCAEYCNKLFAQITTTDAFERQDDLNKVKNCAESLLELSERFESKRLEALVALVLSACASSSVWKAALEAIEQVSYQLDDQAFEKEDVFSGRICAIAANILSKRLRDVLSDVSFERVVEILALRISEELERGIFAKRFTQLGALRLEKDLRLIMESLIAMVSNSLGVRAIFARLMQMAAVLSITALEEAHDVWDSFAASTTTAAEVTHHNKGIKPKDRLNAKEVKRVLAYRLDFDQREVQRLKLL